MAVFVFGPLLVAVAPALVIPLAVYILCNIPQGVTAMRRYRSFLTALAQKHWALSGIFVIIFIFLVGTAVVAAVIYHFEESFTSEQSRKEFHFVIQMITGNWSSPPYLYPIENHSTGPDTPQTDPKALLKLSFSASASIVLSFLTLGLGTLALGVLAKLRREHGMKLKDIYTVRDIAIKQRVQTLFEAEGYSVEQVDRLNEIIDRGFTEGDAVWKDKLIAKLAEVEEILNPKETEDVINRGEIVGKQVVVPPPDVS